MGLTSNGNGENLKGRKIMTDFILAPASRSVQLRESLREMLDAGELVAYRMRANGTFRLVSLMPVCSTRREVTEWVHDETEEGRSVAAVARELHVSVAEVRRWLLALELTEEIEAGEWDEVWAELNGFTYEIPADEMNSEELSVVFEPEPTEEAPSEPVTATAVAPAMKTRQTRVSGAEAVVRDAIGLQL